MAYVSKVWVDRQTEYPTRRKLEFDDGTDDKIVTVSRAEGTIYEAGDIFDANTMNTFESRIAAGIAEKQDILIPGNGIRIDQDNVISATGGGGGIEFTKIESGSLVSVNDAADLPVVDLAVEIKAVQSGIGDPSPSNVRPISGWSSVGVTRASINIWDEQTLLGYFDNTGAWNTSATILSSKNAIPVSPNTTYYIKGQSGVNMYVTYWTKRVNSGESHQDSFISRSSNVSNSVITTPANCYALHFNIASAYGTTYQNDISINNPSTDTAYHAYTGATVNIALGQTVYGGSLDVTSGVMTVTHGSKLFSDLSWTKHSSYANTYYADVPDIKAGATSILVNAICSAYKAVTRQNQTQQATNYSFSATSQNNRVFVIDDSYQDLTAFETGTATYRIVYELAQPVTVQLTPTEVETLLGINNIWADSGDILNLEYYTQSASDVRDFIIKDEEVTDDASWSSEKIQDELDAKQDSLTAGDGIVISQNNEISAVLYKELTATLNVFSTSVVFEDASITTSSVIDIYTSKYGFNPETVTAETGRLTITFRQPEEQITVKVRIS